ncbi:hypothetical protein N0B31_16620 [Salinirubellus salinus]|uniref:Uncharacterized protein n=1 Tax=Salinirubellus salinus TaxID=1364945 RepID=A0A9E7UA19_9EURY|nr:hypothetical protein [Salinirubellus salinus]UWM53748.1 hypothetical protein N0B31_16620 [Salinirubellus salinus]
MDLDLSEAMSSGGNRLKTSLPGVEVVTQVPDADLEELEALHERQLQLALAHAEEAKEATRM